MHPDLYLVIYRQQEHELDQRLRRRLAQTCCAAVDLIRRSRWSALAERVTAAVRARRVPPAVCCA